MIPYLCVTPSAPCSTCFLRLLSEGQTGPFCHAILKITETKQDVNLGRIVLAVAQSSKLNPWELISYEH